MARAALARATLRAGALALAVLACAHEPSANDGDPDEDRERDQDQDQDQQARTDAAASLLASASEPGLAAAPPTNERPGTSQIQAEPEPAALAPAPPPSPEQLAAQLREAADGIATLKLRAEPRFRLRGPAPDGSDLEAAYAEDRAFNLQGRLTQVREWAALFKFASVEPGAAAIPGPLVRYDLVVTRQGERAWLHVVIPAAGLASPGERGRHEAWIAGERWLNLADRLEPGRDYLPFKSNGRPSLHRQWGRATVVESVAQLARDYQRETGVIVGIGDLSHVTGGKIEDHWTHKQGVDADLYLIELSAPPPREREPKGDDDEDAQADPQPRIWWHHYRRGRSQWTSEPKGKGEAEPSLDPSDPNSDTLSSARLRILAQLVFTVDAIAYFVHNDPEVLDSFDKRVGERRPGRRYLHAKNRGYWPTHADHIHLRWVEGELPVGVPPRP